MVPFLEGKRCKFCHIAFWNLYFDTFYFWLIPASDVKLTREDMVEDDTPEVSVPFLTYLTVGLLIFSIFYNVLFYAVIKPSIDGPESAPEPSSSQSELRGVTAVLQ